ncbi:MAG: hypothetical protein HY906_15485 [Deltaproteobacteria bacterium]|nr:hypothetical protein [Deltaproteobacteria bacterium]
MAGGEVLRRWLTNGRAAMRRSLAAVVEEVRPPSGLVPRLQWAATALLVLAAVTYTIAFLATQTKGLFDVYTLEWDACGQLLPTFRYHGSGLFRDDINVELRHAMTTPLWNLYYWVGTFFTSANVLSKLLPFALFVFTVWQGFMFGRRLGGAALGAAVAIVLVHHFGVWDRMLGSNPRAFAYPLVVAFLRYSVEQAERRTLVTLVLQAAAYPTSFLCCFPAYGLMLLRRRERGPWLRYLVAGVVAGGIVFAHTSTWSARVGKPINVAAQGMEQFTLKTFGTALEDTAHDFYAESGKPLSAKVHRWKGQSGRAISWAIVFTLLGVAIPRLRRFPLAWPALIATSVLAFYVSRAVALRLHLPERMLEFTFPSLFLLGVPVLAWLAFERELKAWAGHAAAVVVAALFLGLWGTGIPAGQYLKVWKTEVTPIVKFAATLPEGAHLAQKAWPASFVQTFARRKMLFSYMTNVGFFDKFNVEMDARVAGFYDAYYAADLTPLKELAGRYRLTHLIVDTRDLGAEAEYRAMSDRGIAKRWKERARQLIRTNKARGFALAAPPPQAVVFSDGPVKVLDLSKL